MSKSLWKHFYSLTLAQKAYLLILGKSITYLTVSWKYINLSNGYVEFLSLIDFEELIISHRKRGYLINFYKKSYLFAGKSNIHGLIYTNKFFKMLMLMK